MSAPKYPNAGPGRVFVQHDKLGRLAVRSYGSLAWQLGDRQIDLAITRLLGGRKVDYTLTERRTGMALLRHGFEYWERDTAGLRKRAEEALARIRERYSDGAILARIDAQPDLPPARGKEATP